MEADSPKRLLFSLPNHIPSAQPSCTAHYFSTPMKTPPSQAWGPGNSLLCPQDQPLQADSQHQGRWDQRALSLRGLNTACIDLLRRSNSLVMKSKTRVWDRGETKPIKVMHTLVCGKTNMRVKVCVRLHVPSRLCNLAHFKPFAKLLRTINWGLEKNVGIEQKACQGGCKNPEPISDCQVLKSSRTRLLRLPVNALNILTYAATRTGPSLQDRNSHCHL